MIKMKLENNQKIVKLDKNHHKIIPHQKSLETDKDF